MFYVIGMFEVDMNKFQVGILFVWYDGNFCNMYLFDFFGFVRDSIKKVGFVFMCFNIIGVFDGISMGIIGMCYSLQSREIIVDSIEIVMNGQWYDVNVFLFGCDKNMFGVLIVMGRVNCFSIMVYGGIIKFGCSVGGEFIDIVSVFQVYGQYFFGEIDEKQCFDIICNVCFGGGVCGGMYIVNIMVSVIEIFGMIFFGFFSNFVEDFSKKVECESVGEVVKIFFREDICFCDIMIC